MSITASRFFDTVVAAIALETNYRAGVPADQKAVEARVLTCGELTPEELTSTDEKTLRRKIGFAFRNQRQEHCGSKPALTVPLGRGQWALTEAGVERARELDPCVDQKPNPVDMSLYQRIEDSDMAVAHYTLLDLAARSLAPVILRQLGEIEAANTLLACKPVKNRQRKRAIEDAVWSSLGRSPVKQLLIGILQVRPTARHNPEFYPVPRLVEELAVLARKAGVSESEIASIIKLAA